MNPPQPNGPPGSGPPKPFVRILEQPAKCAIRFRYECEGRSAGSIPGVHSTAENKSFPTIQVCNYRGKAVVVVSCVTKDPPYRPHPHNLVGKEGCKKGVCTIVIDTNNTEMTCTFTSLGIQCVKRKDIEESLKLREVIKVDPFRTGFNHRTQASSIDLNVVRLCFQVFIEGPDKGKFTVQLPPIVSEPIYDKKAMAELIITKLSHYSAPCTGGKEIILLCDRVAKDDIQVRFYHESADCSGALIWEAYGDFLPNDVHKQVAISLRTPKYYDESIQQPVTVQVQLRRPSDGCTSLSRSFQLTPRELDPDGLVRKRHKRLKEENYDLLQEYISLAGGGGGQGPSSGPSGTKRSASVNYSSQKSSGGPGSPKKDLAALLQQSQASTSAAAGNRSPFIGYGPPPPSTPQQQQPGNIVQSNESSNSPKCSSPSTSHFIPIHHASPHQQQQPFLNYGELTQQDNFARPPSQGGSGSPSTVYISPQQQPQHTPSHMSFASPEIQGQGNIVYSIAPPGSSPNPYTLYQQPQPSPNPSIASYSSGVPSPGVLGPPGYAPSIEQPPQQEVPLEVVERFDSLDIDSSELIPDLEFNSNTMLNLMMDTSSGLSLTDSFSDITNGNSAADPKMSKSYNNGDNGTSRPRSKLKLQIGGSNPALAPSNQLNLDTPTIEMVTSGASGFDVATGQSGHQADVLLSVLDVDNNNYSMN